jgi:hypothetical protein
MRACGQFVTRFWAEALLWTLPGARPSRLEKLMLRDARPRCAGALAAILAAICSEEE